MSLLSQVLVESRMQIWQAFQVVLDIKDGWPEALKGVKTSQLAREILNDKESCIEEMKETGLSSRPCTRNIPSSLLPYL